MALQRLQISSVGQPPLSAIRTELDTQITALLGATVAHSKTQLATPTYAFNKDRNQYHSLSVMRRLATLIEPGQQAVLALTDVDLMVPDADFIIGEADRQSRVALLSTFRLRQNAANEAAFKRRVITEALHHSAHLAGLSVCEDARCLMYQAQTAEDVDRKNLAPCSICRNELAKIK
jgi:archaemetzincin